MARSSHESLATAEPNLSFGEFYEAALATPELAVYVIRADENGEFTFEDANDFVAAVCGRPLSEIRGRAPHDVLLPEVADCITTNLRACVQSRQTTVYQRTFEFPAGRVSFRTSLIPVIRGSRGVQYIVGMTRDVTEEVTLTQHADHHAALFRTLGIALPSAIYLLDLKTRTLKFVGGLGSEAQLEWRRGAEGVGMDGAAQFFHPDDWPRMEQHWDELAALADGEVTTVSYRLLAHQGEYRRHVNREIVFSRDPQGKVKLVLGVSEDVSEHDKVEQEVRDLSAKILTLQIEERRRIAEELHDSTGQHLIGASLALRNARALQAAARKDEDEAALRVAARKEADDASLDAMIDDAARCLDEAQREIRVLSYLLHPPSLCSGGLAEAIETFATGFGRRARLTVEVNVAEAASTIDDDSAVHLFRVCQEALTNVYRHANARQAHVVLEVDGLIRLTVKDDGIGFDTESADKILGVGLPGMRERMDRLGGTLQIHGQDDGTTLVATLPLGET